MTAPILTAPTLAAPVLTTDRLTLRGPQMTDWEAWRAFALDERSRFVRPAEMTEGIAWRAFAHVAGMWALRGFGSFVFCEKGSDTALGMAGPWYPMDWPEPEIGWTVWNARAEGKGYAFEAALAARDWARDALGWTRPVSYIDRDNARSVALAERLGCTLDPEAAQPHPDKPCLVYRHPMTPEARP